MKDRVVIVAVLTPHDGALDLFRNYESQAAVIMARYGGRIDRTVVVEDPAFREIHVLSFPNIEAFQQYRADPELAELAELRSRCIAHTSVFVGRDGPEYNSGLPA